MGTILKKLKDLFKWGSGRKRKLSKHRGKKGGGYRSPEEFHADFEKRYGKPGRVPEDVA